MAKKAKRRLEEEAEAEFEFPDFDVRGFIAHESEQTIATGFSVLVGLVLALASFVADRLLFGNPFSALLGLVPVAVALPTVALSPIVLRRWRSQASEYTRGDWVSLILVELFLWLGLWFLLTDIFFR